MSTRNENTIDRGFVQGALLILRNTPRAFRLVWKTSRAFTLALSLLAIVQGFVPLAQVWIGKLIMDGIVAAIRDPAGGPGLATIFSLVALELGLGLGTDLLRRAQSIAQGRVNDRLTNHINLLILEKALALDLAFYENPVFYDQLQNAQREASSRPLALVNQIFSLGQQCITLTSLLAMLLRLHPAILAVLIAAVVPNFVVQTRLAEATFDLKQRRTAASRKVRYLSDLLTSAEAAKEIKLFNLGGYLLDRYRAFFTQFYQEDLAMDRRRQVVGWAMNLLSTGAFYGSYGYMIAQTVAQRITLGDMTLYLGVFRQGQSGLRSVLGSVSSLYENNLYLSSLFDFLALKPHIAPKPGDRPAPEDIRQGIEFRHVTFCYPGRTECVLKDINLTIRPGDTIALVGENGAGKTTLVKLLTRLYDPTEGDIFVDGVNLKDIDPASWQAQIGVISQDFVQYQMSAQENIGFGRVEALHDDGRVVAAAQMSGADPFIRSLPNGYETTLGRRFDDGQQLSGGQWQKVALARAFIRDTPVLVMDEPTAAVDPRAEQELFQQFCDLTPGKISLIITHRFATVRLCARRILVLEKGRIIEDGTHEELMALGGVYAALFTMQAQAYQLEPGAEAELPLVSTALALTGDGRVRG